MKKITLCIGFLCLLFSCAQENPMDSDHSPLQIAELLDRPAAIRNGIEWQNVHNAYTRAKAAIYSQPADHQQYLKLAEVFLTEARVTGEHGHYYPAALAMLDQVLQREIAPSDLRFRALSLKASALLSQHEFELAFQVARAALRLNTYNAQIYGILTDALIELGRYEEAVQMADKMVSIRPDLRSYARISYLREIHGDIPGAIAAMQMAVDAGYPGTEQSAWAGLTLGKLYQLYGQADKANRVYQRVLSERPGYPFGLAAVAELKAASGDTEEAERLLEKAREIVPEVGFYGQLAKLYQKQNRNPEMEAIFQDIQLMLQDDVNSGHNMNLEYARFHFEMTKDYAKALAFAQKELFNRPGNIDVNRIVAMIYYEMEDYQAAEKYLAAASSTQSVHPELLCLRGLLALQRGEEERGLKELKLSFSYDPHQSHPLALKATTYIHNS